MSNEHNMCKYVKYVVASKNDFKWNKVKITTACIFKKCSICSICLHLLKLSELLKIAHFKCCIDT